MEKNGAKALNCTVKSLMHAIQTKDQDAQQDMAHRMIRITKPWTVRRGSELKLANEKPLVPIPKENSQLGDFK